MKELSKMVLLDRIAGVLVASAAGDALGAGYEFANAPTPKEAAMIGGGLGNFEPGEWTDDTSMSLAIALAASENKQLDSEAALDTVVDNFMKWYDSGPADIGIQTRSVLGSIDKRTSAQAFHKSLELHERTGRTAGNGSLMRTGVVALTALGDDFLIAKRARLVSELTHADPLAGDACVIWSIAIDRAIRESRLNGVIDGIKLIPQERQDFWRSKVAEVRQGRAALTPNGFVVSAFQAALSSVWNTQANGPEHLENTLRNAVSLGDDTDTIAAIAGMLVGARWGASAVPAEMKMMLHGWPGLKTPDLIRLAIMASGEKPGTWPDAESMVEHYARSWPTPAYEREIEEVPGLSVGNFPGLKGALAQDADVRISLCRIGERERQGQHLEVWVADSADPDVNPNLEFVIEDTAHYAAKIIKEGGKVFLHCAYGMSRTPIFAARIVSLITGIPCDEALETVIKQLPGEDIKPGLRRVLKSLG